MHFSTRSKIGLFFSLVTLCSIAGAFLLNAAFQPHASHAANANANWTNVFKFKMVPSSPNITSCLPQAQGEAIITRGSLNDTLHLQVHGLAPSTGYDLFVIEVPHAPFGVSWYQSDLETDAHGNGQVSVRGIFNVETFSIS